MVPPSARSGKSRSRHHLVALRLRRGWATVILALSMLRADATAAGLIYVRLLDGEEWIATRVAYQTGSLVVTGVNGALCTLPVDQIDWESTARRNGAAIDLLRLPDEHASAGACQLADTLAAGASMQLTPAPFPPADVERYRAIAVWSTARPVLDGVLDDPAWQDAIPFGEFFQSEGRVGQPASERTEIRVLYDADNIYFGIRNFDSAPDRIVARNMIREGSLQSDDSITLLLDPLHDHRSAYLFGTNPNGMRVDANLLGSRQSDVNRDWDGVWNVVARRDDQGWTAEFEIPLTTVRFRAADVQTWGLAVERRIARKNERSYWPFIPNNSTFYRPPQAGHLTGLRRIRPGADFRIKPYVALGGGRDSVAAGTDRIRDAGVDVRYWPTPTLTTELTVNTDFAQTEVDDVQINLTRFPLYYPEKRQFFLEGGRIFDLGGTGDARIFYSRRIGLSANRQPLPVIAGGRLTGKVGRYYVGALAIRTAADAATPAIDSYAARATRDVFARSQVGALITERRTATGEVNRVVAVDANFYRGNALSLQAFAAKVFDQRFASGTAAARVSLGWNTDLLGVNFSFLDLQENFRPELGFVPRPGMFCYVPTLRFSPRPKVKWIRRTFLEPTMAYHPTQTGVLWTRTRGLAYRVELESGDNIGVIHSDNYERLFKPFAVRSDQSIPAGSYSFGTHGFELTSFAGRPVQASLAWDSGTFYDGTRNNFDARAIVRISRHLSLAPGLTRSSVTLPAGRFTTAIYSTRTTYTFTPNLSLSSLTQWDSDSRRIVSNVRLSYIPKPGADLFVVYTEADQLLGRIVPQNRSLIAKLNYILDF
ncbi:MAG: carbohydrate binding family 9 domain-containing protein [Cyanobacteria bacterium]|nr:carbohydrate binding family 9 domain-containing protein [Cyanobacteriota bacterium]